MKYRLFLSCAVAAVVTAAASSPALAFDATVFSKLDTGIYWYANQTNAVKAVNGSASAWYNPANPTMIYIHGWQPGTTKLLQRETFDRSADSGIVQDLTAGWKRNNWNMGIFYWNQFADEGDVKVAEDKIWPVLSPAGAAKSLSWINSAGVVSYKDNSGVTLTQSTAQMFVQAYKKAMQGYTGNDIRLVGHSLGSQMVIVGAKLISDAVDRGEIARNLLPTRIALLDPAFLSGTRAYLGNRWPGEVARDYVDALKAKGVIVEAIRSSPATSTGLIGDSNVALLNKTAYREIKPWYFGALDITNKHKAAVWHYLWEYSIQPSLVGGTNTLAASASNSNPATRTLMNSTNKMELDQGAYTKTPGDDTYKWVAK